MPRPRKHDKHLPQYMRFKHGAYYFVRKDKWTRLSTSLHEAFAKYSMMMTPDGKISSMGDLFDRYIAEVLPGKAESSQRGQLSQLKFLRLYFGDMQPNTVRPTDIYTYMDNRTGKVAANREKSLLSHVFVYAIRWGICEHNPCINVSNFKEKPRDRLVTHDEVASIMSISSPLVRLIIRFAVITGLRRKDIINFKHSQISEDGLEIEQSKTGKKYLIEWNDALSQVVSEAKDIEVASDYLFPLNNGNPYKVSGFNAVWQRLMNIAMETEIISERFTFHDLRAMTVTNAYEKLGLQAASDIAGHSNTRITKRVYVRNKSKVRLPD